MKWLLFILILFLSNCTRQYSSRHEYYKNNPNRDNYSYRKYSRYLPGFFDEKFESDNYIASSSSNRQKDQRLYLDLFISKFKIIDKKSEFLFLKYRYVDFDLILINQYQGIQIFLTNGEVVKLSLDEVPSTKVEEGKRTRKVYVYEYGIISLDKKSLKKILSHPIQSVRIKGRDGYVDYTDRVDILWNNWKEFSDEHLEEFLK